MRIEIDWTRCDGHGMWALLVPENIDADREGFPLVVEPVVSPQATRQSLSCALVISPGQQPSLSWATVIGRTTQCRSQSLPISTLET